MQLNTLFALFTSVMMVKGAWFAAVAQPVILGLGAVLGALNMDVFDAQPIRWDIFVPLFNPNKKSKEFMEKQKAAKEKIEDNDKNESPDHAPVEVEAQ